MISGMVNISKGNRYAYPYVEAITSFLPVVDEMVVILDPYSNDGTRETLEETFGNNIRIVSAPFDLVNWGRISYGIMKTTGYHACRGDCIVMFDADGVLHEKDVVSTKKQLDIFMKDPQYLVALWRKYRFFTPTKYYFQSRHYGIFNKAKLGDKFDFFDDTKGAANLSRFTDKPTDLRRLLGIQIFGYEHIWDTHEVYIEKVINYGKMIDRQTGQERETQDYINWQMGQALERMNGKNGGTMKIEDHPKVIQEKLRSLTPEHWGYNFFDYAE